VNVSYSKLLEHLKNDPEFMASAKGDEGPQGPEGPEGPEGPAGSDGQDGQDAQLTPEHLATMTAAIIQTLKGDEEFLASVTGPPGDVTTVDLSPLIARIEALEQSTATVPVGGEAQAEWSHLVLLASQNADYWSRLSGEYERALGYYHQLKHLEPPTDSDVGPLPLLVAYSGGKAVKSWVGLRNVSQAFSSLSRGDYDEFLYADGGNQ